MGRSSAYTDHFFASGVERPVRRSREADGRGGRTIAGSSFDPAWSPDGRGPSSSHRSSRGWRRPMPTERAAEHSFLNLAMRIRTGHRMDRSCSSTAAGGRTARSTLQDADGSSGHLARAFQPWPDRSLGYAPAWSPDGTRNPRSPCSTNRLRKSIESLRPDGTTRHVGPTRRRSRGDARLATLRLRAPSAPLPPGASFRELTGRTLARARTAIRKAGRAVGRISRPRHLGALEG